jgi:hypothetical protein
MLGRGRFRHFTAGDGQDAATVWRCSLGMNLSAPTGGGLVRACTLLIAVSDVREGPGRWLGRGQRRRAVEQTEEDEGFGLLFFSFSYTDSG